MVSSPVGNPAGSMAAQETGEETAAVRSLDCLLRPWSVAVIGASAENGSLNGRLLRFLLSHGYDGPIYPVNPRRQELQGLKVYPSIRDTPEPPDLAVVSVPAASVPSVVTECAERGVGAAVILTSGFSEAHSGGRAMEKEILEVASSKGLRVLGPNCEGFLNLARNLAVGFSPVFERNSFCLEPRPSVAVVSQSGGLGFAVLDAAAGSNLNVSFVVTTGNEIDVDVLDVTEHLLDEPGVRVVALIIEGLREPTRLAAVAARAAGLGKRIVVAKLGTSVAGGRAAVRHTNHYAGSDELYRANFRRSGVIEARDQEELVDLALILCEERPMRGPRIGIIASSGGSGVWLADACARNGLRVPELTPATQASISAVLPAYGSPVNPVDVTAQAIASGHLSPVLGIMAECGEVDAIAIATSLSSPDRLSTEESALAEIVKNSAIPVSVYSYTHPAPECIERMERIGVPWFASPARAGRALSVLLQASEDGEKRARQSEGSSSLGG
jgi:acyl-CoA synthetase (NDP forming)